MKNLVPNQVASSSGPLPYILPTVLHLDFVEQEGLEPSRLAALVPKTSVATNYTIVPFNVVQEGLKPTHPSGYHSLNVMRLSFPPLDHIEASSGVKPL